MLYRNSVTHLVLILLSVSSLAFGQNADDPTQNIHKHREDQRKEFLDPEKSPLDKRDRKKFKDLKYYPIDLNYRVKARLVMNAAPVLFKMPTTTTRLPEYTKYGDLFFILNGVEYKLEVYQNPEISKRPGYEDYLFVPFTDETNGDETYDIGRYLEFRIPTSEDIYLDFNLSYNPYCSYSNRYSCPIPPEQNHLATKITAGEKKYFDKKH